MSEQNSSLHCSHLKPTDPTPSTPSYNSKHVAFLFPRGGQNYTVIDLLTHLLEYKTKPPTPHRREQITETLTALGLLLKTVPQLFIAPYSKQQFLKLAINTILNNNDFEYAFQYYSFFLLLDVVLSCGGLEWFLQSWLVDNWGGDETAATESGDQSWKRVTPWGTQRFDFGGMSKDEITKPMDDFLKEFEKIQTRGGLLLEIKSNPLVDCHCLDQFDVEDTCPHVQGNVEKGKEVDFHLKLKSSENVDVKVKHHEECQFCGKTETDGGSLGTCGRCGRVKYCSRKCQVSDWNSHSDECKVCK
ncbi:hypothetical protein HK098_006467 [Nowakowskiella sp. JEL0407]|nr:hypothetical protein HK098_006467 [Nowakowskiella sp. JEL0407]